MSLGTPRLADLNLPPGFVPTQGPLMTPSRVPLPLTSGQMPMNLPTPQSAPFGLPPGFVPTQGPPVVLESFSSGAPPKTPGMGAAGLPSKTPRLNINALPPQGGPSGFPPRTPSGVPLPLSTATTTMGLPDVPYARGSRPTSYHDRAEAPPYEAAPKLKYPMTPARVALPESLAGTPLGSVAQMPMSGWEGDNLAAGAPPTPAMQGRPPSLYAGDVNRKGSSTSLASQYKKFDPSTYVDPAFLASSSAAALPATGDYAGGGARSRASSIRSVRSTKSKAKSIYAASVETATDEDDLPRFRA